MGYLLSEIRRFQKIAGLLTEDDYTIPYNARSGDTAEMGNIVEDDLDLSDTPEFNQYSFGVGDRVYYHVEGEPGEYGVVVDVARNWEQVLRKGGAGINMWAEFFNDEEWADSLGYDEMEDWEAEFVNKVKSEPWFKIGSGEDGRRDLYGNAPTGWYPAEYVRA